jgi:hypothetical protein
MDDDQTVAFHNHQRSRSALEKEAKIQQQKSNSTIRWFIFCQMINRKAMS